MFSVFPTPHPTQITRNQTIELMAKLSPPLSSVATLAIVHVAQSFGVSIVGLGLGFGRRERKFWAGVYQYWFGAVAGIVTFVRSFIKRSGKASASIRPSSEDSTAGRDAEKHAASGATEEKRVATGFDANIEDGTLPEEVWSYTPNSDSGAPSLSIFSQFDQTSQDCEAPYEGDHLSPERD
jgi:hypothetical protein